MIRIAVLDDHMRLVGYDEVEEAQAGDVVVPARCDLPTDGSYRWTGKAFLPRGAGYGRPKRAPVSMERAVASLIDHLGAGLPAETRAWRDWYRATIEQRGG